MKAISKRGQVMSGLTAFIYGVATVAIVLAVVFIVLAEFKSSTTDGNATLAIGTIQTKLQTVPTWIGIIIVVAMAVIVLAYFSFRKGGNY